MLSEGGECVGEVMDDVVGRGGDGYRCCLCNDVIIVTQEGVR